MHLLTGAVTASLLHAVASLNLSLTPAGTLSLSPAGAIISDTNLLPEETFQLTDDALSQAITDVSRQVSNSSVSSVFGFAANATSKRSVSQCKTYAGDSLWPAEIVWRVFDGLLGGALLEVPPIASSCYTNWGDYDADSCLSITDNFTDSNLHAEHPSSIMSPFYEGATCMPLEGALANCTIGGYPYYVVKATNVAQVQLAVNLARNLNLRLVIKNTGHDFSGKSSGAGALSIWTHHLNSIDYLPKYSGHTYKGKALKIGSGVQATQLYAAAKANGVTVVGGEGETVGVAGGYIQGGGHSPLASIYGLAADSALEFDVVTADGRFVTASEDSNADLFWALRGGGGSTFGVVTAVTVKAWPQLGATSTSFTFTTSDTLSVDTYWAAVHSYWKNFPAFADAGTYGYFRIWPLGEIYYFGMTPFFAPNMSIDETKALLKPWTDDLSDLGINLDLNYTYYDNFYDVWNPSFPIESVGGAQGRFASRLFQRENWANETIMNATLAVVRNTTDSGYFFTGFNMKNELHPDNTANSANPAWRGSLLHALTSYTWTGTPSTDEVKEMWTAFNDTAMASQRAITPGSGSYLGESDVEEPDFQHSFWGSNYDRLLSIKNKYDPYGLFYATTGVGSEFWTVATDDGLPTQNGKLCRVER